MTTCPRCGRPVQIVPLRSGGTITLDTVPVKAGTLNGWAGTVYLAHNELCERFAKLKGKSK